MDQARDSLEVREILVSRRILLEGPETGISGVFAGPLWYYFIASGYWFFRGHPFGALFLLILLNTFLTGILMWQLAKKISYSCALLTGISLQFFWPFYETSRYAFNPFPLVFLSFLLILFLINCLERRGKYFLLAALPVGLAFQSEIAGAIALFLFFLLIATVFAIKRIITPKVLIMAILLISFFFLPHLISEINSNFSQVRALLNRATAADNNLVGTNFKFISVKFLGLVSQSTIPQNQLLSLLFFLAITASFFTRSKTNGFTKQFVSLTLALFLISWLWFSSSKGWQTWQTVYLPPLLFVSLILMIWPMPRKIALAILALLMISQFWFFKDRYSQNLHPSDDPSLLTNEIKAIDWVYQQAEGKGFFVYHYLPSVLDYPYQYLFWWYGRQKYHYLPCEYSSYPGSPKLFIRNSQKYQSPQRPCLNLRFLIIEPDKNTENQNRWLEGTREGTTPVKQSEVGKIKIEMRSY
jgi:4-amino-4-deoxy-L-arabinose transferase-like glycosyltransferase